MSPFGERTTDPDDSSAPPVGEPGVHRLLGSWSQAIAKANEPPRVAYPGTGWATKVLAHRHIRQRADALARALALEAAICHAGRSQQCADAVWLSRRVPYGLVPGR